MKLCSNQNEHMTSTNIVLMPLVFLGLVGCPENRLTELKDPISSDPKLIVEPSEIHFGLLSPGEVVSEIITLRNEGTQSIDITDITLEGSGFSMSSVLPLGWLESGEETEFWVEYTPTFTENSGWIEIENNDAYTSTLSVPLFGQGAYPLLVVEPPLVEFGWTELGGSLQDRITLRNDGLADLTITNSVLVGSDFWLDVPFQTPLILTPQEEQEVGFTFTPQTLGEQSGSFWIESDSQVPNTHIQLIGGASDKPVAICSASPETFPLMETTTWIGENSIDPSGSIINEYNWILIDSPLGSSARMANGTPSNPNREFFSPDVEGIYTAQLIVYNEQGQASDPCITSIEVLPPEDPCVDPETAYELHPEAELTIVDTDLPIYVEYTGTNAGYTSELWLDSPTEVYLATGHSTMPGAQIPLSSVSGSQLRFRIDVISTGYSFFSGLASGNPDNQVHVAIAYLGDCKWSVGFEDQYGGGDQDFDDIMLILGGNLEMTF